MAEQVKARKVAHWETKHLTLMAVFTAISVILTFIETPPLVSFLKYDASNVPAMIGSLSFGVGAGSAIGVVAAWIHGLVAGNIGGAVMNSVAVLCFVIPAGLLYKKFHTTKGLIFGLIAGSVLSFVVIILMNLWFTPLYFGYPFEAIIAMMPALLAFNTGKILLNSILSFVIFKATGKFLA